MASHGTNPIVKVRLLGEVIVTCPPLNEHGQWSQEAPRLVTGLTRDARGTLISFLALNLGKPITKQRLCEEVWPNERVYDGPHNLEVHLSALRRELGPVLETQTDTVCLKRDGVEVDTKEFEVLCGLAKDASRRDSTEHLKKLIEIYDAGLLPP